jgi:hypothetical protein
MTPDKLERMRNLIAWPCCSSCYMVLTLQGPDLHSAINIRSSDSQLLLTGLIVSAPALVMREARQLADKQQLTG